MKYKDPFESESILKLRTWAKEQAALVAASQIKIEKPVVVGKFKSSSVKKLSYTVFKINNNLQCNCPGFTYRKRCKHIEAI